nr:intermediate filament protein [Hymenolepis microstoma]
MDMNGSSSENTKPSFHKSPNGTNRTHVSSMDPSSSRSKVGLGTAMTMTIEEPSTLAEYEEEEETSCYTTSQSIVITRCSTGDGAEKTKHVQRGILEQQTKSSTTTVVGNDSAIQPCGEVGDIIQGCRREKCELQRLNDRLSSFIERTSLKRQSNCNQENLQNLTDQLKAAENEVTEIQQRCTKMAEERAKEILEFKHLQEQLKEVCLKNERLTVAHHAAETDARILREEMELRKRVQNAEMKELSALVQRESTQEAVAIFRTEIMQVLREIQLEYEQRLEAARADIHSAYEVKARVLRKTGLTSGNMGTGGQTPSDKNLQQLVDDQKQKISVLEENNVRMERTIREVRASLRERERELEAAKNRFEIELSASQSEVQCLRTDFEALLDSKIGLELEIASYRRLIEREEERHSLDSSDLGKLRLEPPSSKPRFYSHTRSSKGNVCIIECAVDGTSVTVANIGSQREDISGMRLVRQVDDRVTNTFAIPKSTIWSDGCKPTDEEGLELSGGNRWEMGASTRTALLSPNGEEKAVYTLRVMSQPPVPDRSITN